MNPTPPNPDYPVRVEIEYPQQLNRWLPLVKWLLAVPHYIVLAVLAIGVYVVYIVSWFATIITGAYPEGMFNYMVGFERWVLRVSAYVLLQTDQYPPFTLADDPNYPVRLEVDYPPKIARWRPLVAWLLAIPALLVAFGIAVVAEICAFIGFFAILFTKKYPDGLFNVVTIGLRWQARTRIYSYWMEEKYPPFVWA